MSQRRRDPQPYRRSQDGRWCAPYYDAEGKRRVAYGRTAAEALAERDRRAAGYASEQTVAGWVQWWLDVHLPRRARNGRIAASTVDFYRAKARHVLEGLGDVELAELTAAKVEAWLEDLEQQVSPTTGRPLSSRSVQAIHATLRAALSAAERLGKIPPGGNVARLVEAPGPDSGARRWLTPEQAPAFIAATRGDRFEALWRLLLPLGLRIGEGAALTLDAVDLEAGTVRIDRNLVRVKLGGRWVWQHKGTKTHVGATMALPRWARESLARRFEIREIEKAMAGPLWSEAECVDERGRPITVELLFCNEVGQPFHHRTYAARLARICDAAGLPRLTPHELRHSCASILAAQGATLLEIQKLLRHRRQALTADLYHHLVEDVQRAHVAAMDELAE